jgi:CBS domain containing-hemolysin-like protein
MRIIVVNYLQSLTEFIEIICCSSSGTLVGPPARWTAKNTTVRIPKRASTVGIQTGLRLVGGVLLLLANGFFVTTEFAMTRVPQFPAEEFTEGGSRGLERAWEMTSRLEVYLSGCQVGITISSVGLGVVAEPGVAAAIDALLGALGVVSTGGGAAVSVITALALINLAHVVIGEQVPTYLGVERTTFIAKYAAPLFAAWTNPMWPVIVSAD